jgi:hypothetical protein
MSCDPIYIRAGDSLGWLRLDYVEADTDDAPNVPLPGSRSIVEFRAGGKVLLTLSEGAGITSVQDDGQLVFNATATQTEALAPPLGTLAHEVNLAWRNYQPGSEETNSQTLADLAVIVQAKEVSRP